MTGIARYFAALLLPSLTACAVGPDFDKPAAPPVHGYAAAEVLSSTSQKQEQSFTQEDIPAEWWVLFRSPQLNTLIARALKHNPNLKAAAAALDIAGENVLAQNGAYYPSLTFNASASRQKTSAALSPTPNSGALYFSLFTPQVGVSYDPDVFGLNRRTVEALSAEAEQSRYALAAAQVTLTTNVVTTAIQEAALRAQIEATSRLVVLNTRTLAMLQAQYAKGYASRLDVAAQETLLAQAKAALPLLKKLLVQQRDLIKALAGSFPEEGFAEEFELSALQLPNPIPLSVSSLLVEHRPDVLQAMENLHAASAGIGVAIANRLPDITLSADLGSSALSVGSLFSHGTNVWDLGGDLVQPIFDGGMLLYKEHAARAAFVQAQEQYQGTVLTAFQNVADALTALQQDGDVVTSAMAAERAAKESFDISKRQAKAGYVSAVSLCNAEMAYQQTSIALIQAKANRLSDAAALFQALGGGWWNRAELQVGRLGG